MENKLEELEKEVARLRDQNSLLNRKYKEAVQRLQQNKKILSGCNQCEHMKHQSSSGHASSSHQHDQTQVITTTSHAKRRVKTELLERYPDAGTPPHQLDGRDGTHGGAFNEYLKLFSDTGSVWGLSPVYSTNDASPGQELQGLPQPETRDQPSKDSVPNVGNNSDITPNGAEKLCDQKPNDCVNTCKDTVSLPVETAGSSLEKETKKPTEVMDPPGSLLCVDKEKSSVKDEEKTKKNKEKTPHKSSKTSSRHREKRRSHEGTETKEEEGDFQEQTRLPETGESPVEKSVPNIDINSDVKPNIEDNVCDTKPNKCVNSSPVQTAAPPSEKQSKDSTEVSDPPESQSCVHKEKSSESTVKDEEKRSKNKEKTPHKSSKTSSRHREKRMSHEGRETNEQEGDFHEQKRLLQPETGKPLIEESVPDVDNESEVTPNGEDKVCDKKPNKCVNSSPVQSAGPPLEKESKDSTEVSDPPESQSCVHKEKSSKSTVKDEEKRRKNKEKTPHKSSKTSSRHREKRRSHEGTETNEDVVEESIFNIETGVWVTRKIKCKDGREHSKSTEATVKSTLEVSNKQKTEHKPGVIQSQSSSTHRSTPKRKSSHSTRKHSKSRDDTHRSDVKTGGKNTNREIDKRDHKHKDSDIKQGGDLALQNQNDIKKGEYHHQASSRPSTISEQSSGKGRVPEETKTQIEIVSLVSDKTSLIDAKSGRDKTLPAELEHDSKLSTETEKGESKTTKTTSKTTKKVENTEVVSNARKTDVKSASTVAKSKSDLAKRRFTLSDYRKKGNGCTKTSSPLGGRSLSNFRIPKRSKISIGRSPQKRPLDPLKKVNRSEDNVSFGPGSTSTVPLPSPISATVDSQIPAEILEPRVPNPKAENLEVNIDVEARNAPPEPVNPQCGLLGLPPPALLQSLPLPVDLPTDDAKRPINIPLTCAPQAAASLKDPRVLKSVLRRDPRSRYPKLMLFHWGSNTASDAAQMQTIHPEEWPLNPAENIPPPNLTQLPSSIVDQFVLTPGVLDMLRKVPAQVISTSAEVPPIMPAASEGPKPELPSVLLTLMKNNKTEGPPPTQQPKMGGIPANIHPAMPSLLCQPSLPPMGHPCQEPVPPTSTSVPDVLQNLLNQVKGSQAEADSYSLPNVQSQDPRNVWTEPLLPSNVLKFNYNIPPPAYPPPKPAIPSLLSLDVSPVGHLKQRQEEPKPEPEEENNKVKMTTSSCSIDTSEVPESSRTVRKSKIMMMDPTVRTCYPVKRDKVHIFASDEERLLSYLSHHQKRTRTNLKGIKSNLKSEQRRVGAVYPGEMGDEELYGGLHVEEIPVKKPRDEPEIISMADNPSLSPATLDRLWGEGVDIHNPNAIEMYMRMTAQEETQGYEEEGKNPWVPSEKDELPKNDHNIEGPHPKRRRIEGTSEIDNKNIPTNDSLNDDGAEHKHQEQKKHEVSKVSSEQTVKGELCTLKVPETINDNTAHEAIKCEEKSVEGTSIPVKSQEEQSPMRSLVSEPEEDIYDMSSTDPSFDEQPSQTTEDPAIEMHFKLFGEESNSPSVNASICAKKPKTRKQLHIELFGDDSTSVMDSSVESKDESTKSTNPSPLKEFNIQTRKRLQVELFSEDSLSVMDVPVKYKHNNVTSLTASPSKQSSIQARKRLQVELFGEDSLSMMEASRDSSSLAKMTQNTQHISKNVMSVFQPESTDSGSKTSEYSNSSVGPELRENKRSVERVEEQDSKPTSRNFVEKEDISSSEIIENCETLVDKYQMSDKRIIESGEGKDGNSRSDSSSESPKDILSIQELSGEKIKLGSLSKDSVKPIGEKVNSENSDIDVCDVSKENNRETCSPKPDVNEVTLVSSSDGEDLNLLLSDDDIEASTQASHSTSTVSKGLVSGNERNLEAKKLSDDNEMENVKCVSRELIVSESSSEITQQESSMISQSSSSDSKEEKSAVKKASDEQPKQCDKENDKEGLIETTASSLSTNYCSQPKLSNPNVTELRDMKQSATCESESDLDVDVGESEFYIDPNSVTVEIEADEEAEDEEEDDSIIDTATGTSDSEEDEVSSEQSKVVEITQSGDIGHIPEKAENRETVGAINETDILEPEDHIKIGIESESQAKDEIQGSGVRSEPRAPIEETSPGSHEANNNNVEEPSVDSDSKSSGELTDSSDAEPEVPELLCYDEDSLFDAEYSQSPMKVLTNPSEKKSNAEVAGNNTALKKVDGRENVTPLTNLNVSGTKRARSPSPRDAVKRLKTSSKYEMKCDRPRQASPPRRELSTYRRSTRTRSDRERSRPTTPPDSRHRHRATPTSKDRRYSERDSHRENVRRRSSPTLPHSPDRKRSDRDSRRRR